EEHLRALRRGAPCPQPLGLACTVDRRAGILRRPHGDGGERAPGEDLRDVAGGAFVRIVDGDELGETRERLLGGRGHVSPPSAWSGNAGPRACGAGVRGGPCRAAPRPTGSCASHTTRGHIHITDPEFPARMRSAPTVGAAVPIPLLTLTRREARSWNP